MNTLTIPSFWMCIGIYAARTLLWLVAFWLVPIGMLLGQIKRGPKSRTQWAGTGITIKGSVVPTEEIESIICNNLWVIFDLPDEPSIGQYEPTVYAIYKRFGWAVAVWYQMSFRNVGLGFLFLFAQWSGTFAQVSKIEITRVGPFGITYGLRPYFDWRSDPGFVYSTDPLKEAMYIYVPAFNESMEW